MREYKVTQKLRIFPCSFCLDTKRTQKIKTIKKYILILILAALKSFELPRTHFFKVSAGSDINDFSHSTSYRIINIFLKGRLFLRNGLIEMSEANTSGY